jgi:hypothetical protein
MAGRESSSRQKYQVRWCLTVGGLSLASRKMSFVVCCVYRVKVTKQIRLSSHKSCAVAMHTIVPLETRLQLVVIRCLCFPGDL